MVIINCYFLCKKLGDFSYKNNLYYINVTITLTGPQ